MNALVGDGYRYRYNFADGSNAALIRAPPLLRDAAQSFSENSVLCGGDTGDTGGTLPAPCTSQVE